MQIEMLPTGQIFNPVIYVKNPIHAAPVTKGEAPAYLLKDRNRENIKIPVLAVYPNRVVAYNEVERIWQRSLIGIQNEAGKPANETGGKISLNAKKRIMNAVNWLYYLSKEKITKKGQYFFKFRINLITLTLPSAQAHPDKFIKNELLNEFLEWMRYNGAKSYIWKAEPQKNGNIHFHITTNKFLHWQKIRDKWNKICGKHGYIEPFYKQYGHINPNSTDVHSIKKVKKLAAYIAKYLTKESEIRPIEGRIWFLSTNLSAIKAPVIEETEAARAHFSLLQGLKSSWVKFYDYAAVMFYDYREAIKNKCFSFIDALINTSFENSHAIN